jgi:hypothetical protein
MGLPVKMKTCDVKSKIGDRLTVRIEKIGAGKGANILYRIVRGEDRSLSAPDTIVLFREELTEISTFLQKEFLKRMFPE